MGKALDTILGGVTAVGSTLTALTLASGDSLTVKNAAANSKILLMDAWVQEKNLAGIFRVRSPRLHDNVQGIRSRVPSALVYPLLFPTKPQTLIAQDVLIAELSGSTTASAIDSAVLLIYYDDLPGVSGRLISPTDLASRFVETVIVETAITTGTTIGYGTTRALNADFDLLKANTDYALLGGYTDVRATLATLRGPDTGNLRVSFPGELNLKHLTAEWFVRLSNKTGLSLIPVFSSANKAATFAESFVSDAGGTVNANYVFAELTKA